MQRQHVSSSNIDSIGYDAGLGVLEIEFLDGGIYRYYNVPESIYVGIMNAPSCGRYFHQRVKDVFNSTKVV